MSKDEKRFTLRMSQELFDEIKILAEHEHRSVAKQIEYMLSQYLLAEYNEQAIIPPNSIDE